MKNILSFLACYALSFLVWAQEPSPKFDDPKDEADFTQFQKEQLVKKVDSLNRVAQSQDDFYVYNEEGQIVLDESTVMAMPKFRTATERNYYFWLRKKLYNAYPYYLKAIRNYENLNDSLVTFKNNRKVRKYIKKRQKELADEYEDQLRNLTRTEGQILVKLMYRRTTKSTYEILQELRGNVNAFIWDAKAGLFDISLKESFDPINVREDYYLDNLIKIGISKGELQLEDE